MKTWRICWTKSFCGPSVCMLSPASSVSTSHIIYNKNKKLSKGKLMFCAINSIHSPTQHKVRSLFSNCCSSHHCKLNFCWMFIFTRITWQALRVFFWFLLHICFIYCILCLFCYCSTFLFAALSIYYVLIKKFKKLSVIKKTDNIKKEEKC